MVIKIRDSDFLQRGYSAFIFKTCPIKTKSPIPATEPDGINDIADVTLIAGLNVVSFQRISPQKALNANRREA